MANLNDILNDFLSSAKSAYDKGSEDYRQAFYEGREAYDGKILQMLHVFHRTLVQTQQL